MMEEKIKMLTSTIQFPHNTKTPETTTTKSSSPETFQRQPGTTMPETPDSMPTPNLQTYNAVFIHDAAHTTCAQRASTRLHKTSVCHIRTAQTSQQPTPTGAGKRK
ncbi:hypothetical protein [Corynebacterium mendelii]|uniref:hypothetical protein n=1 Tax=Corynebacterium mendelii TaxID=2765362 RepID=UPI00366E66F4